MDIKIEHGDFKVFEEINLNLCNGKYIYFKLKKKGYNTFSALKVLGAKLGVPVNWFGYAGLKDKKAITEQYVSISGVSKNKLEGFKYKDIEIEVVGTGRERICLGDLKSNRFEINVYDQKVKLSSFFVNYFGEQRFGVDKLNHEKGRLLLLGKLNDEKYLERLYLHSYQSYLWNKVVNDYLKKYDGFDRDFIFGKLKFLNSRIKDIKLGLINFDTELNGIAKDYGHFLKIDGIKQKDFLIKGKNYLISDTVYRDLIMDVKDLTFKNKILKFTLGKGAYATIYLRKVIC